MEATVDVPPRTREQRESALAKANHNRIWRAQRKREIRAGQGSARELIARPPEEAAAMKVLDLLLALPKVGRVRAMKMLANAGVSPAKTLAGLSDRQRRELLAISALR
jgi:hypothetical protein